jgi:HD-GYP domain-containing protein (c-di-GMP phosphodiesterase class II)
MLWWKEIARLKRQLTEAQTALLQEQGKAGHLIGWIGRLQRFGISATGEVPERQFAEALIDSVAVVLKAGQVVFLKLDDVTLDFLPAAARGMSPDTLSHLHVRTGEGILGRAAQEPKTVIQNTPAGNAGEAFFSAPYMIAPIVSRRRCEGLLLIARPEAGSFSPEQRDLAALFASQAALTLEDHHFYADRERLSGQMIEALTQAIAAKDVYTHGHSGRTRSLVRAVASELSLPEALIREIEAGAVLHDVGKIGIEDAILGKPDKLTADEYNVMKKHPAIGHRILQSVSFLKPVAAIALYHQEWYNGAGYPEGLAGEEIPLGARIVQILDAWDAMTSDRPYRKAMPRAAAIAELRRQAGTQFDPKLVDLFLRVVDRLDREGIPTTAQPTA